MIDLFLAIVVLWAARPALTILTCTQPRLPNGLISVAMAPSQGASMSIATRAAWWQTGYEDKRFGCMSVHLVFELGVCEGFFSTDVAKQNVYLGCKLPAASKSPNRVQLQTALLQGCRVEIKLRLV